MKLILRKVRDLTPNFLRSSIHKIGTFMRPEEVLQFPDVESSLRCLRNRGYRPKKMIDIGAYHGEWTRMFREIFPNSAVLMIEAQESKRSILEICCESLEKEADFEIALLGAQDGQEVDFTEMDGGTGSSVFEEGSPFRSREKIRKRVKTLDVIASEKKFSDADFLKLDVQGYELEVLKGAKNVLPNAEVILLECSLIPINRGCPLIAEVIQFMADNGFRPVDFCSQIRRLDGALWQTDMLFLKSTSEYLPSARLDEVNWQVPRKLTNAPAS